MHAGDDFGEVVAKAGETVVLRCPMSTNACGDVHSVVWYRAHSRVYFHSQGISYSTAEGTLLDRFSN